MSKYKMVIDGIKVEATPEKPYIFVGQMIACAWFDGLYFLNGRICGTSNQNSYTNIEEKIAKDGSELCEGAVIVDSRSFERAHACEVAIGGPMLKETLPQSHIQRLFGSEEKVNSLPADIGSCDYLSLDLYVQYMRSKGSKIGRFIQGQIVWEETKG